MESMDIREKRGINPKLLCPLARINESGLSAKAETVAIIMHETGEDKPSGISRLYLLLEAIVFFRSAQLHVLRICPAPHV